MDDLEQLAGCKNGSCPKIFRHGARVAVQGGTTPGYAPMAVTAVVRIPRSVLLEAAPALAAGSAASTRVSDVKAGRRVVFAGRDVLVEGVVRTPLTDRIVPGPGETVVEIPSQYLEEAIERLTPA